MIYSAYKLNKQSDNIQPWHIPFLIWNKSLFPCPILTVFSSSAYRFLKKKVRWFLGRKNQYCENNYTTKCNLQIQCDPYQITNDIFHISRTKYFTIHMETQKTPNSQSSLEKEEWSWTNQPSRLQIILQSYSHQDSMVLAQKQKYKSMEQCRKPRNKFMCQVQLDKQVFQKCDAVGEWETRQESSVKGKDQGTNTALRWRCRNWIHASFIILLAIRERMCVELSYNSCGLQGQRTKWSLSSSDWVAKKQ